MARCSSIEQVRLDMSAPRPNYIEITSRCRHVFCNFELVEVIKDHFNLICILRRRHLTSAKVTVSEYM